MDEEERIFNYEEANNLLPKLTKVMSEIREIRGVMLKIMVSKHEIARTNGQGFSSQSEILKDITEVATSANRIRDLIEVVQELGAEVKDIDAGLVDFLYMRRGELVYLCWKLGEEKIRYWHELDSGYSGRKPL